VKALVQASGATIEQVPVSQNDVSTIGRADGSETAMAHRKNRTDTLLLKTTALAAVVALAQGCAQTTAQRQAPSDATVAAHVAAATRVAESDLTALLTLCKPAPAARPPQAELDKGLAAFIAKPAPPPGQAFDNLYFVGADWVSAWAIKTSDGIILIDALNTQAEAAALIEGGMRELGPIRRRSST
jgi:metallo-beta-lactamase class B